MAGPGGHPARAFDPPAWMVKKAQENAARHGYKPDALAKKMQEIHDNPDEAKKKAREHAENMGIDATVAAQNLMAAARLANPVAFPQRTRESKAASVEQVEVVRELVVQPRVSETPDSPVHEGRGFALTSRTARTPSKPTSPNHTPALPVFAPTPSPSPSTSAPAASAAFPPAARQEGQVEKRDERRAKKEKARKAHVNALTTKSIYKSALPSSRRSTLPAAESSSTGAARELASTIATTTRSESVDGYQPASLFVDGNIRYSTQPVPPRWLRDIKDSNFKMVQLAKKRTPTLTALEALKDCIGRCEIATKNPKMNKPCEELRNHVHKAEISIQVNAYEIKKSRILIPENGLPRIFNDDADFPSDLKADAYHLYARWCKGNFSQDILRGINTVKEHNRTSDRLDTAYMAKFPASAKHFGQGELVLGQWWPTQLCTLRDGAHGASQGGIFGDKEDGTYSIVLSGSGYHDKDDGDFIEYSGTEGKDHKATDATRAMIKSHELGNNIRVIRSSMLPKANKLRPEVGLRYDGLYQIKGYKLVDEKKQTYRFSLERCPGQEQIRSEKNASGRPTQFEIAEFRRLKVKDEYS